MSVERSDEDLLDSLYGEREDLRDDGARSSSKGSSTDDDDELELAQLRRLRGVFAELKANQDEPPPAGMALLMAAARQAAEERKPQTVGLWARLRAGWMAMVAHPAMAAAAAAVVVIGASGYLMSRGVKTAESTYSSSDSAPRAASAPSDSAPEEQAAPTGAAGAADSLDRADPSARMTTTAPAAAAPMEPPTIQSTKQEMSNAPATKKPKSAPAPAPTVEIARGAGSKLSTGGAPPRDRLEENFSQQNSSAPGGGASAQAPAPEAPPPPPAAEPSPVESESAAAGDDEDSATVKDQRPSKPVTVESISQQSERWFSLAKSAAAKGDCNAVKLLAQRVQSENPGFYESRFKKDASLAKCL